MKPIQKVLSRLSNHDYYIKHLQILNPVLNVQLTNTEVEVLAGFMSLKGDLIDSDRFGTQARKTIREILNMSSGGLGNHLGNLREKGFIFEEKGKYQIRKFLIPQENAQGYQFKIIKKFEESTP